MFFLFQRSEDDESEFRGTGGPDPLRRAWVNESTEQRTRLSVCASRSFLSISVESPNV